MPDDDQPYADSTTSPSKSLSVQFGNAVIWLGIGFGVTCLVAAISVGLFTIFGATRLDDCRVEACTRTIHLSTVLGWWIVVLATAILVALLLPSRLPDRIKARVRIAACLASGIAAVALVIIYRLSHFTRARDHIATSFRASEQMWFLTATVGLFCTGAFVVAVFAAIGLHRPDRLGIASAAMGVAVALVLTGYLSHDALRRGDDTQYIDATTAPPQPVPPLPATLGQQRFVRELPNIGEPRIFPAGAGFIVLKTYGDTSDAPDVVAYDASGNPRWHYQRTGPVKAPSDFASKLNVGNLRYFDDASVVVLSVNAERGLYVGLDAVTGVQLWTSTDHDIENVFGRSEDSYLSSQFISRDDTSWTAFDPRTGQRRWKIKDPAHCPADTSPSGRLRTFQRQHVYPVDTQDRIGAVVDCSTPGQISLRVVNVDPSTGGVTSDAAMPSFPGVSPDVVNSWSAYAVPGADALLVEFFTKEPSPFFYVDRKAGRTITFSEPNWLTAVGNGTFVGEDRDVLHVYSNNALQRCDIPLDGALYTDYVILRDEIAVRDTDSSVNVYNRSDCRLLDTVATPALPRRDSRLIAARGVTLLYPRAKGQQRTTIAGFAP